MKENAFAGLIEYLAQLLAIIGSISYDDSAMGWWVKFKIDINHPLAWAVVQELGHVLNELSILEKLPTVFKPVSPPPYLNGGPEWYLSWVIVCSDQYFSPEAARNWLRGRLPQPVDDLAQWRYENDA